MRGPRELGAQAVPHGNVVASILFLFGIFACTSLVGFFDVKVFPVISVRIRLS